MFAVLFLPVETFPTLVAHSIAEAKHASICSSRIFHIAPDVTFLVQRTCICLCAYAHGRVHVQVTPMSLVPVFLHCNSIKSKMPNSQAIRGSFSGHDLCQSALCCSLTNSRETKPQRQVCLLGASSWMADNSALDNNAFVTKLGSASESYGTWTKLFVG